MFSIDLGIDAGLLRQKGYQKSMQKNLWPYEKSIQKIKGLKKNCCHEKSHGEKHWPYEKSKKNKGPPKKPEKMAIGKAF